MCDPFAREVAMAQFDFSKALPTGAPKWSQLPGGGGGGGGGGGYGDGRPESPGAGGAGGPGYIKIYWA